MRLILPSAALAIVLTSCSTSAPPFEIPARSSPSAVRAASPDGGEPEPCWEADPASGADGIAFSEITADSGLVEPLTGMYGHAAAWGDVNGDGWADLFVGTFADRPVEEYRMRGASGPSPDRLLLGGPEGFKPDSSFPEEYGRTSGAAFADLDGDGDLDLAVSRNTRAAERGDRLTEILENEGGTFRAVEDSGIPIDLVGRSIGVLDADLDGLLDLFVAEDRWSGGSSVLMRNTGDLRFADATTDAGLPLEIDGFGVGVSDLTNDGFADIFVAGSNRLFVGNGDGMFHEAASTVFEWDTYGPEDDVTGVSIGDVNRDGLPDIVLGQHYNSTVDFGQRVPVRLYLNRGVDAVGDPQFQDVTEASGLTGLPTKAPHVEINDFDNDGWPEILTTASAENGRRPAIFRHLGLDEGSGGVPRFSAPTGLGNKQYWVTGPTSDVDRDGRLDIVLVEWEPGLPSLLLRNESASGNWLSVSVGAEFGGGIGARVHVYEAGHLGDSDALLGMREIVASQGYAAGHTAEAHFGLGGVSAVDVQVQLPGAQSIDLTGLPANRHIRVPFGCG